MTRYEVREGYYGTKCHMFEIGSERLGIGCAITLRRGDKTQGTASGLDVRFSW